MNMRNWLLGALSIVTLAFSPLHACELTFTTGGSSLAHTGPVGTTQAEVSFDATNTGSTPCTRDGLSSPGIVVQGAIGSGGTVTTLSYAPFRTTAIDSNGTGGSCFSYVIGTEVVACTFPSIAVGQSVSLRAAFNAPTVVTPPFCFQAASFGRGPISPFFPFSATLGYDVLRGCAGQPGGGGGNPLLIVRKDDEVDPVPRVRRLSL